MFLQRASFSALLCGLLQYDTGQSVPFTLNWNIMILTPPYVVEGLEGSICGLKNGAASSLAVLWPKLGRRHGALVCSCNRRAFQRYSLVYVSITPGNVCSAQETVIFTYLHSAQPVHVPGARRVLSVVTNCKTEMHIEIAGTAQGDLVMHHANRNEHESKTWACHSTPDHLQGGKKRAELVEIVFGTRWWSST